MHNHYHVVLFIDRSQADHWDALEVIERWHLLFSGTPYSQRFAKGESLTAAEQASLNATIALWRERLIDVSWFMRIVNEGIARMTNREDDCTGRFWEGHFSSQALLDEKAKQPNDPLQQTDGLHPFAGNPRHDMPNGLSFKLTDYLELVDWTGRILRDNKRRAIPESTPKILQQLNIDPKHWCYLSKNFESQFKSLVGTSYHIK
jgi:hypothetical protein